MQPIKLYLIISFFLVNSIFLTKNIYKNVTPSLKLGYYIGIPLFYKIKKNDLIIFCLQNTIYINNLKKLHLIMNNQCDNKMPYFIKRVLAITKDKVSINESGIYLNNQLVNQTKPLKYLYGQTLIHTNIVNYILKDNEFIVVGDIDSSYDSRYFGIINKKDIKRVAYKLGY